MRFTIAVIVTAVCAMLTIGGMVIASAAQQPTPHPVEFVVSFDVR